MTPAQATARLDRAAVAVDDAQRVLVVGAGRMAAAAVAGADRHLARRTGALVSSIRAESRGDGAEVVAGGPEAPYLVHHEARLGFVEAAVTGEIETVSRALSDLVGTSLGGGPRGE